MSDFKETTFSWTVHNFDIAPQLTGHRLASPTFGIHSVKNSRFSLLLYPRGARTKDENYVSLFLIRHNDDAGTIHLKYEFFLIDESGKCTKKKSPSPGEFPKNNTKGYCRFCDRSLLLGPSKHSLLPDSKLTVMCRLLPVQGETECEYTHSLSDCEVLSRDFAELLKSGTHSDLIIQNKTKEFRVHKAILEARCPQLMLSLVETRKLDVQFLQNIEARALQAILHYIYTGIFESIEELDAVFLAANRYALADLTSLLFPYSYSISAKTVIECCELSFEWIIPDFKNFSQANKTLSYFLVSDDVSERNRMKVSLFAKEREDGRKGAFLRFQKLWDCHTDAAFYFKIEASDKSDNLFLLTESVNVFENGKFEIPFDAGMDSAQMPVNGNLKLRFHIRSSINDGQSSIQKINLSNAQSHTLDVYRNWKSLQRDLGHFYDSLREAGDVTLNMGPRKLSAHKAVLCSRSEVFRKMLEHDSPEGQAKSVDVEDVDEETMSSILKYVYCGVTDELTFVAQAIKMYCAADKYQLLPLKEKCSQYLKSYSDTGNVREVLLLADVHSDEVLKKCVLNFIIANASEILQSQDGLEVLKNRGDLYQDIVEEFSRRLTLQNNFNVLLRCTVLLQNNTDETSKNSSRDSLNLT